MLFAHDFAVELVGVALFLLKDLIAPVLKMGKAPVHGPRVATLQPHDPLGQRVQERPIVADEHNGRARLGERVLHPLDRRQIHVVGRLVEQKDVGVRRERARDGGPARLPSRQPRRVFLAGQAQVGERQRRAMRIIRRTKAGQDKLHDRIVAAKVWLLLHVPDCDTRLDKAFARIGFDETCSDFQQGGFA